MADTPNIPFNHIDEVDLNKPSRSLEGVLCSVWGQSFASHAKEGWAYLMNRREASDGCTVASAAAFTRPDGYDSINWDEPQTVLT